MNKILNFEKVVRWGVLGLLALAFVLGAAFSYYQSAIAAASLTITPITWNIIGLDSNDVTAGSNNFPVGARVCNTGDQPASNVTSTFEWGTKTSTYINLRSGSLGAYDGANALTSLGVGECHDFYYEIEVTRDANAYDETAEYFITATADSLGTVSTTTPRELYVERLISQSRNSTTDVKLDGVSVPAGGTMALAVYGTYDITLDAKTATNGYEQIESFINFANTIFKINSVTTSYSADAGTDSDADTKLYADGCSWDNDPDSPNYLSCLGTGKYGGIVSITYNITIIGGGGTTQTLNTLIYDFSGSSFHYNADYTVGARYAAIIDPTSVTIDKKFTPAKTGAGGVSTLTFTLSNPNGATVTDVNFTDTFPTSPGAMVVANPTNASTSGCGTPTFAPAAGAGSITFSDGTIPANGSCVINVDVTVPVAGVYNNTSGNLFIGSVDTGNNASSSLEATTDPVPSACVPGMELARWEFTSATLAPTFQSGRVSTATASYSGNLISTVPDTQNGQTGWSLTSISGSWPQTASPPPGYPLYGAAPHFEFYLDTSNFTDVQITFDVDVEGNWANSSDNHILVWSNADGGSFGDTPIFNLSPVTKNTWYLGRTAAATATGSNTTAFRINELGAKPTGTAPRVVLDNVIITGCGVPAPPTIAKNFVPDPIGVNGVSTLTFNLTNENNVVLTGVRFEDVLPAGLKVATPPNASTTCSGTPTWTPAADDTTLVFGDPSGATIPARVGTTNGTCSVQVNVTATTSGPHQNVSGFIYSTETYTNTGPGGSASDSLTAILPPQISKSFTLASIVENGVSTLTFLIVNPNPDHELTGVQFTDTLPTSPANMVVANPANASTSAECGTPTFAPGPGDGLLDFSNGTIPAAENCIVKVDVTAPANGVYTNTSGTVSATIPGAGNITTATLTVTDPNPGITLLKQVSTDVSVPRDWSSFVSVPLGGGVYYRFSVENTGDVALTNVIVTDPNLNTASCSWVDGDGNSLTAPFTLPAADANDDAHLAYCVLGPVSAVSGWNDNTATAQGTYIGTVSDTSTASYATTGLSLVKSVDEIAFAAAGDVLHYTFVVTNTGAAPLQGPVTIADDKASDESCPPVTTVGDGDNWLDPGETITCTATYTVTAGDVSAGSVTNTASATADNVTSNTDQATVNQVAADYGDLPGTYNNTVQSDNGARHTTGTMWLGAGVTTEGNGQENPNAAGDSNDDGVLREMSEKWLNDTDVTIYLNLQGTTTSGNADVGIWIDWNNDQVFGSGEFFGFPDLDIGNPSVKVTVPDSTVYTPGDTLFVRVRAFDQDGSIPGGTLDAGDYVGLANNGEVEDYMWEFRTPTAVSLADYSAQAADMRWVAGLAGLLLMASALTLLLVRKQKAAIRICKDDA